MLCLGLDKPKTQSYILDRYIEALGHKWRACSGASCIPKRIRQTTHQTSQQPDLEAPFQGMNQGGVF